MLDAKQIRISGVRFGQALLATIHTATMYSVEHPSIVEPAQHAFDLLNALLKEGGAFTLGFVDDQVLLNNLLTKEPSLSRLQSEFQKRGVAAVTFEPGLTFARFKRAVMVLGARPKVLEDAGGLLPYLEKSHVEGVRILPLQKRHKTGDTVIGTDSEAYILSRQRADGQTPRDLLDSLATLLEASSFDAATRNAMLAEYASGKQAESVAIRTGIGGSQPTGTGENGSDTGRAPRQTISLLDMITATIEGSLADSAGDPRKCYVALMKFLRETRVDAVLSYFPPEQQAALKSMSVEEVATEYVQESALRWAGKRLAASAGPEGEQPGAGKMEVEEEVLRVLVRCLQATQMADRLAAKLAKFFVDYAVPAQVQERIRDELHWTSLTTAQKHEHLMRVPRYSASDFTRLLEQLKEFTAAGDFAGAKALATHYFELLGDGNVDIQPEELSHAGELIRALPLAQVPLVSKAIERLRQALNRSDISDAVHLQSANILSVLAQSIAPLEDFDHVLEISAMLRTSRARDPSRHEQCCGTALSKLIPATSIERILELYLSNRPDPAWIKKAVALLRLTPDAGVAEVFNNLAQEVDAKRRLALLRLISRLGPEATHAAQALLSDSRWYVVRNMCLILAELKDPDLTTHLAPALSHPDARVQQAAIAALIKTRAAGRAEVFGKALAKLAPSVLDGVLDELLFLKDPVTIAALESLIVSPAVNPAVAKKAAQVLAGISGAPAAEALGRLLGRREVELSVRRLALASLLKLRSPLLATLLQEIGSERDDPIAAEAQIALAEALQF